MLKRIATLLDVGSQEEASCPSVELQQSAKVDFVTERKRAVAECVYEAMDFESRRRHRGFVCLCLLKWQVFLMRMLLATWWAQVFLR